MACLNFDLLQTYIDHGFRTIGGRAPQFPDIETYRKVQVDYTLAGANAFAESLASKLPEDKRFRFVFCSGKYAECDQDKPLAFLADTRHMKVWYPKDVVNRF